MKAGNMMKTSMLKTSQRFSLMTALVLTLAVSCASVTRHQPELENQEFFYKLSDLDREALGSLKAENPALDLRTLEIREYPDLYKKVEKTEDSKRVIRFIQKHTPERKVVVQKDTFYLCLRSEDRRFVLIDNARTPGVDHRDEYKAGEPMPSLEEYCGKFVRGCTERG